MTNLTHGDFGIVSTVAADNKFEANVTAIAYDDETLLFLAICGPHESCKAIASSLSLGRSIRYYDQFGRTVQELKPKKGSYQVVGWTRIESISRDSVIIVHRALSTGDAIEESVQKSVEGKPTLVSTEYVYLQVHSDDPDSELKKRAFAHLRTPDYPEWRNYVWESAKREALAKPLYTQHGTNIWKLRLGAEWEEIIQFGLRLKVIPSLREIMGVA